MNKKENLKIPLLRSQYRISKFCGLDVLAGDKYQVQIVFAIIYLNIDLTPNCRIKPRFSLFSINYGRSNLGGSNLGQFGVSHSHGPRLTFTRYGYSAWPQSGTFLCSIFSTFEYILLGKIKKSVYFTGKKQKKVFHFGLMPCIYTPLYIYHLPEPLRNAIID